MSRKKTAIGKTKSRKRSQKILLRLRRNMYTIAPAGKVRRILVLCGIHLVLYLSRVLPAWGTLEGTCTFFSEQAAEVQPD